MTTNSDTSSTGLLTEDEAELLIETDTKGTPSRSRLIDCLTNRLWKTFRDIELLYTVLTDEEFQAIFTEADDVGAVRARSQHGLTFLYYGLMLTGDDVAYRVTNAIKAAEAAIDRDATVNLDITTQPFLPPGDQIQALKNGNHERVSAQAFERLWYDDRVDPADVADVFAAFGDDDLTVEEVRDEREAIQQLERMLPPVITNIERTSASPEGDED